MLRFTTSINGPLRSDRPKFECTLWSNFLRSQAVAQETAESFHEHPTHTGQSLSAKSIELGEVEQSTPGRLGEYLVYITSTSG